MKNNQKGFSAVLLIIVIAVIAIVGLVGWRTYATYNSVSEEADAVRSEVPEGYAKTTIDFSTDGKDISVVHPEDWAVKDEVIEGPLGAELKVKTITSSLNNSIKFSQVDGLGGSCDPNADKYTLIKKIPTKISKLYFTEYDLVEESAGSIYKGIRIEDMTIKSPQHANLKEGDAGTDTCTNLAFYSVYNNVGVDILMSKDGEQTQASSKDIADDEEFVKMLQSFTGK